MPAVAVTDHGNLFAAAKFFHEASKRDVKPIIGCEVYVAKGSRHDRGEKTTARDTGRGRRRSVRQPSRDNAAATTWCCCAKSQRDTAI